jgi:hypothetical protein
MCNCGEKRSQLKQGKQEMPAQGRAPQPLSAPIPNARAPRRKRDAIKFVK